MKANHILKECEKIKSMSKILKSFEKKVLHSHIFCTDDGKLNLYKFMLINWPLVKELVIM